MPPIYGPLLGQPIWGEHLTDARLFAIALIALAAAVTWLAVAAWRHTRNLAAIPVRIHVAGTRGKSTTTRMVAAGLRAGGQVVAAKSTGSEPRFIRPDGGEEAWRRRGPASIAEQRRFFARAVRLRADAAVLECMAIRPEFVWASERHLVRATLAVITNARADHFEDVGEGAEAMAEALAWVVPAGGRLVVSAEAMTPGLAARAAARGTAVTVVETAGLAPLAADRALALAVCAAHGVPPEVAGPAMDHAAADPGLFFERPLAIGDRLRFANAFACNDVTSFAQAWDARTDRAAPAVVLLNARRDRPLRTRRFLDYLAAQRPPPLVVVAGDPSAVRYGRRRGAAGGEVRALRARTPAAALAEVAALAPAGGTIWGAGNYHGLGAGLIRELGRA